MARNNQSSLNSNKTLGESPVPLLVDIVEPVAVKDEVKKLDAENKDNIYMDIKKIINLH